MRIHYVRGSFLAVNFIWCIRILTAAPIKLQKIERSLGDLKIDRNAAAIWCEANASAVSENILKRIKEKEVYKGMIGNLPQEKVETFFQLRIYDAVLSVFRLITIIEWSRKNDPENGSNIFLHPRSPLLEEIKTALAGWQILIEGYRAPYYFAWKNTERVKIAIRRLFLLKTVIEGGHHSCSREPRIAVHYAEGIDITGRSDIFWYKSSGVDPKRMLLYFDRNKASKTPVTETTLNTIREMGIQWVSLVKEAVSRPGHGGVKRTRIRPYPDSVRLPKNIAARDAMDIWIILNIETLKAYIAGYAGFFKAYNIKIVFDISSSFWELIAQNIALDLVGGIRIGVQRSILVGHKDQYFLRYNSNHVFFIWGSETLPHRGTSPIIKKIIISGYPFDNVFQKKSHEKKLFTVALFDNAFNNKNRFSEKMMKIFYQRFIEWLIDDETIMVRIKEKKQHAIDRIPSLRDMVSSAEKTGRFVRLENTANRFPSDISSGADIAIGIGISSAVAEAVITGCRGIHCDLPGHRQHPYYRWGYGTVVFDDMDSLMRSLKRYKEDPASEPNLGDWSSNIDCLDPFRDGRSGERIGSYMRWILEGLDKGLGRYEAMGYADKLYAETWGKDKVNGPQNACSRESEFLLDYEESRL